MLTEKGLVCGLLAILMLMLPLSDCLAQTDKAPSGGNWIVPGSSPQSVQPAAAPAMAADPAVPQAAPPVTSPAPAATTLSPGMAALQRTTTNRQYLFIFFNNGQNEQTDTMWAIFHSTLTKLAGRAEGIPINISDPLEQEIVKRFDVSRAPMPLVLVLAPNGAIMGGFPSKFDEAQLMGAFGTPTLEATMKGLQEKKLVILCIQNQNTQQNEAAMYGVNELRADPQFGQAVYPVMVNPADPNESKLFTMLQVDPGLTVAQTVMLLPPGSAVGKFMGGTTKSMLTSKLQSSGGCGPGGCAGGKCGPGGCGPAAAPQSDAAPQPQQPGTIKRWFSKAMGN